VSPIFVRPVREQLEHDRLIRFLQTKYRKLDVAINVGDERVNPVKIGVGTFFPDLVLTSGKKLAGLVEVETGESVNNLEALAQWVHFSRARVPFHLYVPVPGYDAARRLCEANGAKPSEIWTYRPTNDGFDLVRIHHEATTTMAPVKSQAPSKTAAPAAKKPAAAKPPKATSATPVKASKDTKPAKSKSGAKQKPPAKPARKPAKSAKGKK
jgi:hypothetical protein